MQDRNGPRHREPRSARVTRIEEEHVPNPFIERFMSVPEDHYIRIVTDQAALDHCSRRADIHNVVHEKPALT